MIDYPRFVKGKLTEIINKMAAEPKLFVKNPNSDFTRKRKLSFDYYTTIIPVWGIAPYQQYSVRIPLVI
jgi:hypothetical protein